MRVEVLGALAIAIMSAALAFYPLIIFTEVRSFVVNTAMFVMTIIIPGLANLSWSIGRRK